MWLTVVKGQVYIPSLNYRFLSPALVQVTEFCTRLRSLFSCEIKAHTVLFCWLWIALMQSQLLKNNLSHLKRIAAIGNLMFEIYLRFSRIQTNRIFYFLRRLFAKHQTLSSSSRTRSRKIRRSLFIVVIVISILLKPTFWQISIYSQSLLKIL